MVNHRRQQIRKIILWAGRHLLGTVSLMTVAVVRPGPVVRWLSRRYPDVLFQYETHDRMVGLSFDDSPHAILTPRILDVLAKYDARATFFMIGNQLPGNEAVVHRIVAGGHELGNHLMADEPSIRLPIAEFERQLQQSHALLAPYGPVRWFRPGHGWFNRRMLTQIQALGYQCVLASSYALEFLPVSAPYAARHILLTVQPGSVIVLHDGTPERKRTVAVLELLLPALKRRGYRVVNLSELVNSGASQQLSVRPGPNAWD